MPMIVRRRGPLKNSPAFQYLDQRQPKNQSPLQRAAESIIKSLDEPMIGGKLMSTRSVLESRRNGEDLSKI